MMNLKKIFSTGAICLLMAVAYAKQPNVVFFALDDMNDWVGAMGYEQAVTPNMDRLAASGVNFQNAHTAGIFCAPSRSAIFTGRHASTTGCYTTQVYFHDHPEITPLQKVLQDGGYATYGAGKLFHHPAGYIDLRGWDEFFVRDEKQKTTGWGLESWQLDDAGLIPQPFPTHSVYRQSEGNPTGKGAPWFLEWGKVDDDKEEEVADTMRTNWACDLLKQQHDKPLFVAVGLYSPHFPNFCPAKYFDLYDRDELVPPPYKTDDLDDLPPAIRKKKTGRGKIHKHLEEIGAVEDAMHGYLACISYADAMLGRVLDAIESGPNADNTIVVLWSDHGYHHGEKYDWGKHTLWERTSNIPFMWAGPGITKGGNVDATVSLMDMFPTLTDLCEVSDEQSRDGISLVPVLKNPAVAKDRDILLPGMKPGEYAMMNEDWRYIRYADGAEELYNVKNDPNEWNNLASDPELDSVKKTLQASAPQTFADLGPTHGKLKLEIDGDGFTWRSKNSPKKR
jgi:arylsulfatase A-like enzyme